MKTTEEMLEEERVSSLSARLDSYKRLADVFHDVLSQQSLDTLLDSIADALSDLVPYDTLTIYEAEEADRSLVPVLARDQWADQILKDKLTFGEGITGWAAEHRKAVLSNEAHLDPRVSFVPDTPLEPEAIISVPLIARGAIKGVLNIYRQGESASFSKEEFELANRFGDAAAIALDNAQGRALLERIAQTDSLTGLYNHRYFQEQLKAELTRASRIHESLTVLMMDIDDFKKLNDVYGHAVGDHVLRVLANILRDKVRGSDIACRVGGEELAVILPSCRAEQARAIVERVREHLAATDFDPAGRVTLSIGVAQGPEHASNPISLVGCAEAAMMTAKAQGKDRVVIYDENVIERPSVEIADRKVRSVAHLNMLQSLAGKLSRLNDVSSIGMTVAEELRTLIDYHHCIVFLRDQDLLAPLAFKGQLSTSPDEPPEVAACNVGEGISGKAAATGRSLLVPDVAACEFANENDRRGAPEKSVVAVPLSYGTRILGVVLVSKLGTDQFDREDVRLLEVLAGHASVALENARLYEAQRREADSARALLDFADQMSKAPTFAGIGNETVRAVAKLLEATQSALWLLTEHSDEYRCAAHFGYVGDPTMEPLIREAFDKRLGDAFLEDHGAPFVMPVQEAAEHFGIAVERPDGEVAIAPLHGIDGWIVVRAPLGRRDFFNEARLRLLAGVSYQASVAMEKALLYKDQKENADIANSLLDFGRELSTARGLDQVLARTVELAARIVGSPRTAVWLQDPETRELGPAAAWGYERPVHDKLMQVRLPEEGVQPFLGYTEPFTIALEDGPFGDVDDDLALDTLLATAPLRLEAGRLGFLVVGAPALGDYQFSERKMRLLAGIAHQATLAINNAAGFEVLERTFLSTVESLAHALAVSDTPDSAHTQWMVRICLEVGARMRLSDRELKHLELGAMFHDVGKVGIPPSILLKAGPLTEEEWTVIRAHPQLGEKILEPIDQLELVRPIVRLCHERYDGHGGDTGVSGEAIPIQARIIYACDAYHAMLSDRPYRSGMSADDARAALREGAGTQFDPRVVDALIVALEEDASLTPA